AAVLDRLRSVVGRGYVETAFGFAVDAPAEGGGAVSVGTVGAETARLLGVVGLCVLVVRPDRYIGLRRDGADPSEVADPDDLLRYVATLAA
ncbi:MAG: hypothetical protein ACRDZ2_16475, partial [Ilumatobacteraceae bacterium]